MTATDRRPRIPTGQRHRPGRRQPRHRRRYGAVLAGSAFRGPFVTGRYLQLL